MKYQSPISYGSGVMSKSKILTKKFHQGQTPRSRSKLSHRREGLDPRNMHVQCQSPISYGSGVMSKTLTKNFHQKFSRQIDRQTKTICPALRATGA